MTLFKLLLQSSGLSTREAADYLDASLDSVKSWNNGRRDAPAGVIDEMAACCTKQNQEAALIYSDILAAVKAGDDAPVIFPQCADDAEAEEAGYFCKSMHDAILRRALEQLPPDLITKIQFENLHKMKF